MNTTAARGRGASPGGSPRPAMDYRNRERGDGSGKPITPPPHTQQAEGLTWGNSPQITQKGLNYYRDGKKRRLSTQGTASGHGKRINGDD